MYVLYFALRCKAELQNKYVRMPYIKMHQFKIK